MIDRRGRGEVCVGCSSGRGRLQYCAREGQDELRVSSCDVGHVGICYGGDDGSERERIFHVTNTPEFGYLRRGEGVELGEVEI